MKLLLHSLVMLTLVSVSGCSTLGISLWPAQFPLMKQTKEFMAASPMPTGLPHELTKQVLPEYFLEPGDRILIESTSNNSKYRGSGDQKLQVDGTVDLGEFGRIRVAGLTVEAVESAIEDRMVELGATREEMNVQLVETNAAQFYALGEVGSPGAFALNGNETVLDGILRAGGLTSKASPCEIILVRPTGTNECRVVLPICYRQITQLGDATTNYQLQPGDRIVVGSRSLCEELAVWKQTQGCERCCGSRCVECNPASVNYRNRIMDAFASISLIPQRKSDQKLMNDEPSSLSPTNNSQRENSQPKTQSPDQDSDIYIPLPKPESSGAPTVPRKFVRTR